ncbi:hypothetical protein FHS43_002772 [Streptosporangium becharense]|uniref:Uncharacterized protein n=1 Tax=Streptosporangium becharense TaxID=1816182 RepID=A0A7W9IM69_9ACTN|nr:hypothetical protein [Streptosporangium becharense]MBB2911499.1 hypothetical protein [Streptosporangium becharense]MBB5822683.1 hypothetical protein [Streptosporangium becharense]
MHRALGFVASLVLIAAALVPPSTAQAACLVASVKKCDGKPMIDIDVTAKSVLRSGGRIAYTLDYTMTSTPSFAPYWGTFWVGGRFPAGTRGLSRATLFDATGARVAVLTCRKHSDGVWCAAGSTMPNRGKVVFDAKSPSGGSGTSTARLGFDSFESLTREQSTRRYSRQAAREKFCNHRFNTSVTTAANS